MIKLIAGISLGLVITLVGAILVGPTPGGGSNAFGKFVGQVKTTFLDDGRLMQLDDDFAYVDPENRVWPAPAGSVIDGASIPQVFWSVIGGPFEGQFRNAAVIHDVACQERKVPSDEVHYMFYCACRCGGVSEAKAKALYYAVSNFGPQWDESGELVTDSPEEVAGGSAPPAADGPFELAAPAAAAPEEPQDAPRAAITSEFSSPPAADSVPREFAVPGRPAHTFSRSFRARTAAPEAFAAPGAAAPSRAAPAAAAPNDEGPQSIHSRSYPPRAGGTASHKSSRHGHRRPPSKEQAEAVMRYFEKHNPKAESIPDLQLQLPESESAAANDPQ